jgi:class 3 adenylate cyclase
MAACPRCGTDTPADARFCPACGAQLTVTPAREARKLVTVLFCDLVGSTAISERLDPEAFRALQSRYFALARGALERHGGTVEKFIGDAVMAVFGVPTVHEDDALRAVRAAVELRDGVTRLGESVAGGDLAVRIGINCGEVFTGAGESLVSGDAVVTAKRLEEAAPGGGILLGPAAYALVRDAVEAELLSEVQLKGKRDGSAAYLLRRLDVRAEGVARRLDLPLVGRAEELAVLR